jgi:hypothetical protein
MDVAAVDGLFPFLDAKLMPLRALLLLLALFTLDASEGMTKEVEAAAVV